MAPARLSMPLDPIYRGSTWRLPVQFLNEDQTPFDLTGAEVTAYMERNGLPRQRVEVVGSVEGEGLVTFNGDETETATWAAGRYGIEIRLAIADDVLSVLVATIPVVKGPADGGADAVLPGAAQIGGVQGVVVSATGMIRAVIVDRVRIGGGGSAGEVIVPQELADLFGGSTNLADVLAYIAANMGSAPSPILQTLAGNIVSQAVLSGALSVAAAQQILLTGALSSTTGLTGSLSVGVAGSVALVGTAISTSTASGALSLVAQIALAGAATATSTVGGALSVDVAPVTTLAEVPNIANSLAVYSFLKVDGQSTPGFQARRTSDSALMDVPWITSGPRKGYPDFAAVDAWAGTTTGWRISKVYEALGRTANDITVANVANWNPNGIADNGFPALFMENFADTGAGVLTVPDTVTGSVRNFTLVTCQSPFAVNGQHVAFQVGRTGAPVAFWTESGPGITSRWNSYTTAYNPGPMVSNMAPTFYALVSTSANLVYHQNSETWTTTASPVGTYTGALIGGSTLVNGGSKADLMFFAIYEGDKTADLPALKAALAPAFGITLNAPDNIVEIGDSNAAGIGAAWGENLPRKLYRTLTRKATFVNNGYNGRLASAIYTNRVKEIGQAYRASKRNTLLIEAGVNDIFIALTPAATLYDTIKGLVAYANGVTYGGNAGMATPYDRVVVFTIPPSNNGNVGATYEPVRLEYNQLVRDGAAANGYVVADLCTTTAFDAVPDAASDWNNTTFYGDKVHYTAAGFAQQAPVVAAQIN